MLLAHSGVIYFFGDLGLGTGVIYFFLLLGLVLTRRVSD